MDSRSGKQGRLARLLRADGSQFECQGAEFDCVIGLQRTAVLPPQSTKAWELRERGGLAVWSRHVRWVLDEVPFSVVERQLLAANVATKNDQWDRFSQPVS